MVKQRPYKLNIVSQIYFVPIEKQTKNNNNKQADCKSDPEERQKREKGAVSAGKRTRVKC